MSDRDAVSRVRTEFVDAFNGEKIEAMAALLADDNISMAPNRPPMRGKDESRQFWREGFAVASSKLTVVPEELQIIGDVAIDQFHWTMDSTPRAGGSPIHDEGKCIWIWRRQSDGS
jgi:ketosteroid isomerase-like protein